MKADMAPSRLKRRHRATHSPGSRQIAGSRVVDHHPIGAESPSQAGNRMPHHEDPIARQAIVVSTIETGYDLLLEYLKERICISLVGHCIGNMAPSFPDRETVESIIGLRPPTIEDRAIEASVEHHFLAARS